MLSKKTAIGMGVGSVAIVIGVYFLVHSIVIHTFSVNETVGKGDHTFYDFNAQKHYHELLNVTGNSFHVKLKTPGNGLQVDEDFNKEIIFDWYSLEDGQHIINITNTGNSDLHLVGTLEATIKPFELATHMIAITSGIVIIGISAAFTIRKPRGF